MVSVWVIVFVCVCLGKVCVCIVEICQCAWSVCIHFYRMICSLCLVVQVQSAEIHTRVRKQMCVHLCVYVHICVCGNCDEAKE